MIVCKECGVELEDEMEVCPLCDTPVAGIHGNRTPDYRSKNPNSPETAKKHLLKRVLWQITSVLLVSGIVATVVINISRQGSVTWSVYPVTICLIILSYSSLTAWWYTRFVFQMLLGWLISALVLVAVDRFVMSDWPLRLALPLLSAVNVISLLLYWILIHARVKGLNLVAIIFLGVGILCMIIDGVISYYFKGIFDLQWSVIVGACLLPVIAVIIFMHFRTRNNTNLQKIFHT